MYNSDYGGEMFNARTLKHMPPKHKLAAKYKNNNEFWMWFNRILDLCSLMFKWDLPDTCNPRYLERQLFFRGTCGVFNINELAGAFTLPYTPIGTLDIYDEPIDVEVSVSNYYGKHNVNYRDDKCNGVIVRNLPNSSPTVIWAEIFAQKIADSYRTIDVYHNKLKSPTILEVSEEQALSLSTVLDGITGNELSILVNKGGNLREALTNAIEIHKNGVYLNELWQHNQALMSTFLTFIGINSNPAADKMERVNVPEVESTNQFASVCGELFLKPRQEACLLMRDKLGVSASCEFSADFGSIFEGGENGSKVYDRVPERFRAEASTDDRAK